MAGADDTPLSSESGAQLGKNAKIRRYVVEYSLIVFSWVMLSVRGRTPNIEPDPLTERMARMEKSVDNLTKLVNSVVVIAKEFGSRTDADSSSSCEQGPPGRDGRDGRDGVRGDSGPPGIAGQRGPPGPVNAAVYATAQISEVLRHIDNIFNTSQQQGAAREAKYRRKASGGSVYVRWGRTVCPGDTILLYPGVTGGSHYTHGGSANYVCLPLDPEWANTMDGHQSGSSVYGAEYETNSYSKAIFSRVNADGKSLHDHDVPCAVCHAESRSSQVMIPANLHCPIGWNKEYSGYLMSEHITHSRTEYICVDGAPEADQSGHEDKNGALLYFVEAYCGSLPCPRYREGHELTCVVCTK